MKAVVDRLLEPDEPSVRYKVRVGVLGEDPRSRGICVNTDARERYMSEAQMERREFLRCMGCAGMAAITGCTTPELWDRRGIVMSTDKTALRPESLSYCGVDCSSCDVFNATVHGDHEARIRAAKLWTKTAQEHWGMETLDPMILDCTGCRAEGVKHKGYGRCPIPPCARKRNLVSCGLCPEWKVCERLSGVFAHVPEARENLQKIAESARH